MQKALHPFATCLALALLVWSAFGVALTNGFVSLDDAAYVTANPHVQAGLTWPGLEWAFTTTTASNWHPLTWLSHMIDCQLFGLRPWGHHLSSLLLHTATTLLLFLFLKQLTGLLWRSWFAAALFGVHPLRVESVAWVAERKDTLSGLFFVLTLWAWCRFVRPAASGVVKPDASKAGVLPASRKGAYCLALLFFTLGLLSKPMLVTVPLVLLLLDIWPLRRWQIANSRAQLTAGPNETTHAPHAACRRRREEPLADSLPTRNPHVPESKFGLARLLLEKLPFFLLAGLASIVTLFVQTSSGAAGLMARLPLGARFENALVSYVRYLAKLCWPANLAVFYPHPGYWPLPLVLGCVVLLAGITAVAWRLRSRHPYLLVGWVWYLATLVPVIGLIQVGWQSIADRYTYLPAIGLTFALVWSVASLTQANRKLVLSSAAAGLTLIVTASLLTARQAGFWKNSETLFRHAIDAVPDNFLAHANLAECLQSRGRLDEAFREVDEALRLNPEDVNTRNSCGTVLLGLGRIDEAIGQFQEAIRRQPGFAAARSNLAYAYERQNRLDQAQAEFAAAIQCSPNDYRLEVNLAGVLIKAGRAPEAIPHLQRAVRLAPGDASIHKDLAALLANSGRLDEATAQFAAAAALQPNDAELEANLGLCLSRAGRTAEAREHLARALALRPNDPTTKAELEKLQQR